MQDLLEFRLPPFLRLNWVTPQAQTHWLAPMQQAARLWLTLEIRSVVAGLRSVTVQDHADLASIQLPPDLIVQSLPALAKELPGPPMVNPVVIGRAKAVRQFAIAWQEADLATIGQQLGYPPCCIDHFQATYRESRLWHAPWAWLQTTQALILDTPPAMNILLSALGLRLVPHIPCSPDCAASQHLASAYQQLVSSEPEQATFLSLQHILAWPIAWSALHGIAEIKTPVVRISMDVAATGQRYHIQKNGQTWPRGGAHGIHFPYQQIQPRQVRDTVSWQRGLQNPIVTLPPSEVKKQVQAWLEQTPEATIIKQHLSPPTGIDVDWWRVGVPQADGYDTRTVLACAAQLYHQEARCEKLGDRLSSNPNTAPTSGPSTSGPSTSGPSTAEPATFLDGAVRIHHELPYSPLGDEFVPGPSAHATFQKAEAFLRRWPLGFAQVKALVHTVAPAVYRDLTEDQWGEITGSCSHCFDHEFGLLYATIHDPMGLAQALVHEMAHMKLFALGFGKESSGHLIDLRGHE